jgi:integrase
MFRLGERAQKVGRRPHIAMLAERNVRKGFVERAELGGIIGSLTEDLRPVIEVAYITGWRVASEILTREWKHVDFAGGFLRLEPGNRRTGRVACFRSRMTSGPS